jgi:hypothetical protein
MYKRAFLVVVTLFLFLIFGGSTVEVHSRELKLIKPGDLFPKTSLKMVEDPLERKYLGLKDGESFTVSDIRADVVLVEIISPAARDRCAHIINCSISSKMTPKQRVVSR